MSSKEASPNGQAAGGSMTTQQDSLLGDATGAAPATCKLRIRLPCGQSIEQTFCSSDTLQTVMDFIKSQQPNLININLKQPYPLRTFTSRDFGSTLDELKLTPNNNLTVERQTSDAGQRAPQANLDPGGGDPVPDGDRPPMMSEIFFRKFAKDIGTEWTSLATHLQFINAEVTKMQIGTGSVDDKIFEMLVKWSQKRGKKLEEMRNELVVALREVDRDDLANKVQDY